MAEVEVLVGADGSPLDNNPIDSFTLDAKKNSLGYIVTYWVRGGEHLNVWLAYYEPDAAEFGDFHSKRAELHLKHFYVGDLTDT
jgi:salicylate hydroxylase